MRYLPINNKLFAKNRHNFIKKLKPNSIAIFHSNDIMPTNADGAFPFKQNNDLFYLSGIDQENTILVLYPDARDGKLKEILFIKETNEFIRIWEGNKWTKEEAKEISGISNVKWNTEFEKVLSALIFQADNIYLPSNEHLRAVRTVDTQNDRFTEWCKKQYPLHNYERAAPILEELRAVKSREEIDLMKNACSITKKAFLSILDIMKPGVAEFEVEAEFFHQLLRNRSRGPAYQPIVASGENACILHYIDNSGYCNDGELVLLDLGVEYGNYCSDLSRTIPVNGRYTKRQREVYNAVLRVMKEAKQMLVPGNTLVEYEKEVGKMMTKELIGLGLLSETDVKNQNPDSPAYRKYFMHGTSHFIGLDTHDVGSKYRKFEEGMVFTCEPGIYIREEGIGIRLENDIVVTENGPDDLMADIPLEADEIEDIMNQ